MRAEVGHTSADGANVPDVDHERCVHTHVTSASCRACADACPHAAWVIDDETLGIDTGRCDGCGVCIGACPEAAIAIDHAPAMIAQEREDTALLACDVAVPERGPGVRACLDSISHAELARLYQKGVRRLVTCRGDCSTCPRGTTQAFDKACDGLARLLDDRGLAAINREDVAPARWLDERERSARLSRRGFLMALRSAEGPHDAPVRGPGRLAAATVLPGSSSDETQLTPVTPKIDAALCTACDACSRICPHAAITLETPRDAAPTYHIKPARCTGCRMCIDVCDVAAVSLDYWQRTGEMHVALDQAQCTSCGNVFRHPRGHGAAARLCRICAATPHNANLFQVLE